MLGSINFYNVFRPSLSLSVHHTLNLASPTTTTLLAALCFVLSCVCTWRVCLLLLPPSALVSLMQRTNEQREASAKRSVVRRTRSRPNFIKRARGEREGGRSCVPDFVLVVDGGCCELVCCLLSQLSHTDNSIATELE